MKETNTHLLFPTPIYCVNDPSPLVDSVHRSFVYDRLDKDNGDISNDKKILEREEFKGVREVITLHLKQFVYDVLKVRDDIEFYFTDSWITRHAKNDFSHSHIHANSMISGCYYLEVYENSGRFIIENSPWATNIFASTIKVPFKEHNMLNSESWIIEPKKGDLVLFPSTLFHSVTKNETNLFRYCLAFNTFVKGKFGNFIDKVELL